MFWYRRDPDARLGVGVAFTSAELDLGDLGPRERRDADLTRLGERLGVDLTVSEADILDGLVMRLLAD